jgi:signal transduction histidine kinase
MTDDSTSDGDTERHGTPDDDLAAAAEALFRTTDEATFLVSVGRENGEYTFTFRRSNPAHRRQTGLSADDLRGQTPREVFGADQGGAVAEHFRRCVDRGAQIEYEVALDLPAGRARRQTTLTPVTEDGEVTQLVGSARPLATPDEGAPGTDQGFLDAVIESLPYPFYVIDVEDYTVEYANSDAVASEGATCYQVTHKRDQPCDEGDRPISCPLSSILDSEAPQTVEHVHYDEAGNERTYQVHAAPVFDDEGRLRWIGESSIDITERVRYEDRLATQRDNLEVLNQMVRHDIRNDLQLVLAYAETLAGHVDAEGQEYLDQILDATREAVDITKTARDVTEVLLQSETARSPVGLRQTLEDEVDDIRSSHEHALVTLEGSIPALDVLADDMLSSVFRNLLANAIVHNDTEIPEVAVSATETDDCVRVRIADNGPGIPDDQKERIFEEGEKGLDSEGTGLGLYLVQTLVDRYGGDVWVEDRADVSDGRTQTDDPRGSVFVVELVPAE